MKISPISGTGTPGVDIGAVSTSRSHPDRIAAAKAVAAGETPPDKSLEKLVEAISNPKPRSIKMRTQVSPDRQVQAPIDATLAQESDKNTTSETSTAAAENSRPIDPQLAALAKARRAFQQEKAAFDAEKANLQGTPHVTREEIFSQLKSNPLGVLGEAGVSYDDLTQAILNGSGVSPEIVELRAKIDAIEKGVETKLTDREAQAEQQALLEMRREAQRILRNPETPYRMAKSQEGLNHAMDLIERQYKATHEVIEVDKALDLVEKAMVEEHEQKEKLLYPTGRNPQPQPAQQVQRGMRTLTNRDEAQPVMSRRDRMMAAFSGTLKR